MKHLIALLMLLPVLTAYGQTDETVYRLELGGGLGAALNFTDVADKPGVALAAVARLPIYPRMAAKLQFTYNSLKGNTTQAKGFLPARPDQAGPERLNHSVSGGVCDLSALYELHFLPYGYVRDYKGHCRLVPYLQVGFGLTYGTAAQAFTPNIPLGAGLKYKVAERLNLGIDWLVHFTLNDKLDDLKAPLGISASGFRNKDHYSALTLTLTYDLNPRCPTCNRND